MIDNNINLVFPGNSKMKILRYINQSKHIYSILNMCYTMESSGNIKTGGSSKKAIIAIAVVIVLIAAGVGTYFIITNHPTTTSKTVTITVAAPVYSSSTNIWENFINNATAKWQQAHPNVVIKFVGPSDASSEAQYYDKLDLMTSKASTAPDVMLEDMFYTATYAHENVIAPLNSYMNSTEKNSFFPSALGQMEINGTIYGMPTQVTDTLIYYNMSLFQKAGIKTPWQPTSWADLLHTAMELKANLSSINGFVPMNIYTDTRGGEAASFTGFEGLLYGTGWGLYNFSSGQWYGNNPGLNATLNFYKTAFVTDNLATVDLSTTPYITTGQYLQEGKLGIAVDGSWMYGYQWASGSHEIHNFTKYIGVAYIPTEFGQAPYYNSMVGGWGWAMYSGVSNKSLVYSFMQAMDNTTNQININLPGQALAGGLPATTSASSNPLFKNLMPNAPQLDTFYANALKYGSYRPPVSTYPTVSTALQAAMSDVVVGGKSVSSALSAYDSALVTDFGSSKVQIVTHPTVGPSVVISSVIHTGDSSARNIQSPTVRFYNNLYIISKN